MGTLYFAQSNFVNLDKTALKKMVYLLKLIPEEQL